MSSTLITVPPEPGQVVRVRQRQYLVEEKVLPQEPGDATLVRMSCLDDDAQGQALEVLWESEVDPEIMTAEAWDQIASRGFDPPPLFAAYVRTLRWNSVTATDPRLFQSPFRAGIKIDAYQLEPLRKALQLPRVNLFIADDVGLGKTIEAGLIARELLLRKKVREIVVSCPPSMLLQWQEELETRFGLTFQILDKDYVARVRRERGYGVNPWATQSRFLISQRLLIDEAYVATLRDWLRDFRSGSLLILDEAHHAAPSSGVRYAIDSKITRAIRDLAHRFEHRLFLSATPHNGHSNSFSALLELLDPQRFCRGVPVRNRRLLDQVMVRRLKDDIRELVGGLPKRRVVQIDIKNLPRDAPEIRLAALLDEYRQIREQRLSGLARRQQSAAALLIVGLQVRLFSSVEAFAHTLGVHRRTVRKQWDQFQSDAAKPPAESKGSLDLLRSGVGGDDDRATLDESELRAEEEAQIEAASAASFGSLEGASDRELFEKEQKLLDQMEEIAKRARGEPDARVRELIGWIRSKMCPELPGPGNSPKASLRAKWNDVRVIIFTEWDDTKRYLVEQLSAAIAETDQAEDRIAVFHGPTSLEKREEIKRAFNADPKKHAVRILIATDAAREGLNLQSHCWNLFHFDVPWNPSRLEQRNGRIDRKLQPAPEVFCRYFVYTQRPEDRVLRALINKTETIRQELRSLSPVIEDRLADTLKAGIRRADVERLVRQVEEADVDPATRKTVFEEFEDNEQERKLEVRNQIEKLRDLLERSAEWVGLKQDQFQAAISSALELIGVPALKLLSSTGDFPPGFQRYRFPAIDQREGADPSWSETMDALRAPRKMNQKLWEWRRDSPVQPVVFRDPETMDAGVAHLHLEHRVVRRLLGRFSSQGFVQHDLSRACLAQTVDAIPRIILIGRLSLYGPGAARLHEELLPVAARWVDPVQRKGRLLPYGREAVAKSLDLVDQALSTPPGTGVPEAVAQRLRSSAPQDIRELLTQLEERGRRLAEEVKKKLSDRGEREASEMRRILEEQRKGIDGAVEKYRSPQLVLEFDDEARRQLESDRRHWSKRLAELESELDSEPKRIRDLYEVKAQRLEPIGIVYLWPVTG